MYCVQTFVTELLSVCVWRCCKSTLK